MRRSLMTAIPGLLKPRVSGGSAAIYGVSWDKGSDPTLTRTDDAVGMVANAGVGDEIVVNDFDSAEIYSEMTEVTDALGNVFIRIPRFYIRKTDGVGFKTWQISKQSHGAGWYLPWCFWDFTNSRALDYVDVGKYNASLDGSNRLESKPDTYPLVDRNIVQFRDYARANGAGYQLLDIHVVDVLQTLFYVEFATLNSQSIMAGFTTGRRNASDTAQVTEAAANRVVVTNATAAQFVVGQSIGLGTLLDGNQIFGYRTITAINDLGDGNSEIVFDGAPVDVTAGNIVYSTGWKSGFSAGIAASSGSPVSNSSGKYPMVYRGIENVWGSVWQFVDGVNINDHQAWVAKDADDYASNLFAAPYEQLGYVNHNVNGYTVEMGHDPALPFAEFPIAVGGSDVTYYGDRYQQATGQRIALFGGNWNYDSFAGLSLWNLNSASGSTFVDVGGRLVRKEAA